MGFSLSCNARQPELPAVGSKLPRTLKVPFEMPPPDWIDAMVADASQRELRA